MALEWQTLLVVSVVASLLWMLSRALKQQIMPPPGSKIPPMPPTSSVIGHLALLDPLLHKKALLLARDYGPVFRLKLFSREVVIINDLENLKAFSAVNELLDRPDELNRGREFYNGLMTLNGELWSANRRFCMTMLRDLGFARCKTEEKMMTEFNILKEKIEELNGEPMSMGRCIPECLTCNIAAFFYGSCLPENSSVRLQFNDLLRRFLEIFAVADVLMFAPKFVQWLLGHFPFTTIGKGYVLMDELDRFIMKEIVSQSPTSTGDMKRNFVPRYLEKVEESKEGMNPKFEYRHLVGNVKALIGAGILGATASVLFHLANFAAHQDTLQRRVQEEIDEVLGPDREPTWEDRKRMHFTFACVIEAERCKASVPLGIPRLASKDVVVNNFFIKKGTVVLFNLWGIDNDPLYWKEPQRFNPFRYLSEEGYFLPETARRVVAFSLGRRSCPGETFALMEIFLIITSLLQKYQVVHHEPFHLNLEGGELDASDLGRVKIRFIPRRAGSHGANISST